MGKTPHLVQYQGSKRLLAPEIIKYFPAHVSRLIEPFCGTCAVTIYAALHAHCDSYWINDINGPLVGMMKECIEEPERLAENYAKVWQGQYAQGENNCDYFFRIRDEFNAGDTSPENMLFLLARVVKGAVRYNDDGTMNQSCDKRRYGTKPETIRQNAVGISQLLKGKTTYSSLDYREVLEMAEAGDLIYMDPPYQGTSEARDSRYKRYIKGVDFDEFVEALDRLNKKKVAYIVSYDGRTGDKVWGKSLPDDLGLTHILLNAGTSAQATLMGRKETTYESLYFSPGLVRKEDEYKQMSFVDLGLVGAV